jgi:hypothetical protein
MRQVATNSLRERVAPLHQCLHAMWAFEGSGRRLPLVLGKVGHPWPSRWSCEDSLRRRDGDRSPPGVRLLWDDANRDAIVTYLPDCDE